MKKYKVAIFSAAVFLFCLFMPLVSVLAAVDSSSGGYLSQYQNVNPQPTSVSWISTLGYLLSLIIIFVFVIALAYYVSHYLGGHFGKQFKKDGNGSLLINLPLGPNKFICVVEVAEHVMVLGVTDHNITLLHEITDIKEIEKLHLSVSDEPEQKKLLNIFGQQFRSLDKLSKRFPDFFKNKYHK